MLLKAVGLPSGREARSVYRARAKLEEQVRLAALEHPGILRVHGLHKAESAWYVITAHPVGHTLDDLLALVAECDRWFSPFFTLYVGEQVASALEHAHTAKDEKGNPLGIVHRAIDLEHVFVDLEGGVQVSDFGLALSRLPGRVVSSKRRLPGDAYFASPEMLLGRRVDARSDLFMLGLVMLELSTGKNLLDAPDGVSPEAKATLSRRQLANVERALKRARLAGCDAAVETTIWRTATYTQADVEAVTETLPQSLRLPLCKLLQRSPAKRYQTAGELATELRGWLGGHFGKEGAAAELMGVVKVSGEAMVEMGLGRPRRHGLPQDEISTR